MAFQARFSGTCSDCGKPINVGDAITWSRRAERGKRVRHASCDSTSLKDYESYESAKADTMETTTGTTIKATSETKETKVIEHEAKVLMSEGNSESGVLDVLGDALWSRIKGKVEAVESKSDGFDRKLDTLRDGIRSELAIIKNELLDRPKPITVELKDLMGEVKDLGIQHKDFPTLLKMISARDHKGMRLNIWITGPAGTGKTSAVEEAAKALGLKVAMTGALTESYKVFGYMSPGTGQYIRTPVRDAWEFGGLALLDDFDGSDPAVAVEFNAMTANGIGAFPDAMVPRHPDCCLVLTANTWGLGATNDYVGRFRQDAAFLDRFVKLHWEIDEQLESATCTNEQWVKRVQAVRAKVKVNGIKVMVTPRASYYGAALLATGLTQTEVEASVLRTSMTEEQWNSVR